MTSTLFTSFTAGPITYPHRVAMAPMTRCRADVDRVPTDLMIEYYSQRASAALLITEASQVSPTGIGYPGTPGIHTDAQVAGWRKITDAVHQQGGRIFLQLWHVGRVSHPDWLNGDLPVGPSAIAAKGTSYTPSGPKPFVTPRPLELHEIPGIIALYRHGAECAQRAGFDGVEIHGANGYLLDQFLRDGSNQRTDEYGGTPANRARLHLEVTDAVIGVWGSDRVAIRISPNGSFNDMSDSSPSETFGYLTDALNTRKLAYLHVIELLQGDDPSSALPISFFRERFHGPLMVNGGFTKERAEHVLNEGLADLIAFGVPFLANPDLPARLRSGAALNAPNPETFYGGGAQGYTDYPALD